MLSNEKQKEIEDTIETLDMMIETEIEIGIEIEEIRRINIIKKIKEKEKVVMKVMQMFKLNFLMNLIMMDMMDTIHQLDQKTYKKKTDKNRDKEIIFNNNYKTEIKLLMNLFFMIHNKMINHYKQKKNKSRRELL